MTIQIGAKQLELLKPYTFENYITELVTHCNQSFPYLQKIMPPQEFRQVLSGCINRAKESGFTQRGPVQFYIDMMIIFGAGFENDPQYPWISETLKQNAELPEIEQADLLFFRCNKYLKEICGENNSYEHELANTLKQFDLRAFVINKKDFEEQLICIFETIYPQKVKAATQESLKELISEGMYKALDKYHYKQVEQNALFIILTYLYGHEFDTDPFLAMPSLIANRHVADGGSISSPERITQQLESLIKKWNELKIS